MADHVTYSVATISALILLFVIKTGVSQSCSESEVLTFESLATKRYDKLKPPSQNEQPVIVNISVAILSIKSFDQEKMNYETDIFFHQLWFDYRLKIPVEDDCYENVTSVIMDNAWRKLMWTPDTFFKNSEDGKLHDIVIPYMYSTLDRESRVFFAARLSLKLTCNMDLTAYPHDIQYCTVDIMSRKFSYLVGTIKLSRRVGYFMINKYIPSVLVVFMAFLSFWIPAKAYPARVSLSITSLLTIITQQFANDMPSVSYVIALNVWMMGCVGFVFSTLLEYAFVVALMEFTNPTQVSAQFDKTSTVRQASKSGLFAKSKTQLKCPKRLYNKALNSFRRIANGGKSVDMVSRFLFPFIFFVFCTFYWIKFVMKKDDKKENIL